MQTVPARAPGESLENGPRRFVAPRFYLAIKTTSRTILQQVCDALFVNSLSFETQEKETRSEVFKSLEEKKRVPGYTRVIWNHACRSIERRHALVASVDLFGEHRH